METRQMTIDDYLNEPNGVAVKIDNEELNINTQEPVALDTLTKAELIAVIEQKDKAIETMSNKYNQDKEEHKKELDGMNDYYREKLKQLSDINNYYVRKLKIINDIVNIELGGE